MREIKFRAWDKVAKAMSLEFALFGEFTLLGAVHDWQYEVRPNEKRITSLEMLQDLEIMQFTGLKDKNGKEIYEGDIVSLSYGTAIVKFINECGAFMLQWIDDPEANLELLAFSNEGYRRGRSRTWEKDIPEVIGNIYENPELLTKETTTPINRTDKASPQDEARKEYD